MSSALFIDLEKTLVESIDDSTRMEKFDWIVSHANLFDQVFLFSFAIHDERDFEILCSQNWFTDILNILGIHKDHVIFKNSLKPSFDKIVKSSDLNDFHDLCHSKELAFECFCRFVSRATFTEFELLDDMVEDKKVKISGKMIRMVKV